MPLKIGDKLPEFSLKDHEGMELNSQDLIGSPFIIYFYPKDDTPGCTKQACAFRDVMEEFDDFDVLVIGISPDSAASHTKFIEKYDLNFPLLTDENLELATQLGAVEEKVVNGKKTMSIVRSTFLIDSDGVVCWIEKPVSVEGHAERVLEALEEHLV